MFCLSCSYCPKDLDVHDDKCALIFLPMTVVKGLMSPEVQQDQYLVMYAGSHSQSQGSGV